MASLVPALVVGAVGAVSSMLDSSSRNVDRVDSKIDAAQREQSQYNYKMAEKVSGQGQQLRNLKSSNDRLFSRTDKLRDQLGEAAVQLGRVESDTSSLRRDQDRHGAQFKQFQSDQNSFNMEVAARGAQLETSHKLFKDQQRSFNDNMTMETAGLRDKLGENTTGLEVMKSRADYLKQDQDRISSDVTRVDGRVDKFQADQNSFNREVASRGATLETSHRIFSEQQRSFNDDIRSETAGLRDKLGENSTGLEVMRSRAEYLKQDQDRISMDVTRVDDRVDRFQADQTNMNLALNERSVRMEEHQMMFSQQQGMFNKEFNSRTVALQEKLGNTSTRAELAHARSDHLQHGLNELSLDQRQTNQRIDQFQSDHNNMYLAMTERTVRNEARQSYHMDSQNSFNERFLNKTDSLTEKYYNTDSKVDLVSHRADTLRDGQAKIDADLRLERQIAEERQREQTKYNQMLAERNARVEERQTCYINEQKTHNDQILNRTENVRDKLGETSKKVDFMSYRVDNLHVAQQKAELELKDKDKQWRDDQRHMSELLQKLLAQVSGIDARTKVMESRLDALQADYNRVNEMCIKFEATIGNVGKHPVEFRNDLNIDTNETMSRVTKMSQM